MMTRDLHAAHREAQEALPWLANGTLVGTELERVQAHVHGCAACRSELALLHTLRGAEQDPLPGLDMEGALARLLPQLDAPEAPTVQPATLPVQRSWRTWFAANDGNWLRTAAIAQCCVIAILAGLLLRPAPPADFHMLGATAGAQSSIVVTFRPETPERELRRIVGVIGGRVIGGPTVTGAWLLATEENVTSVVVRLRKEPAVTLAEPFGAEGRP